MKKMILGFVVFIVVSFIGLLFYLQLYGKELFLLALNNAFKRPVSVAKIAYQFPLGLRAEKLRVEGIAEASSLEVQIALQSLFEKKIHFSNVKISQPVITFVKVHNAPEISNSPASEAPPVKPPVAVTPSPSEKPAMITQIDRLVIKQGQLNYQNNDLAFQLENVDIKAHNLILPAQSVKTDFHLKARVIKENMPFSGGDVEGQGWFNLVQKDMQADVKISHPDGPIEVTANISSEHNEMNVKGNFSLGQFRNDQKNTKAKTGEPQNTPVQQAFSYAVSSMGLGINAQFSFQTKMDDFQIGSIAFSGDVVQ